MTLLWISPPGRSWSALAVLMIGTFMFVLDTNNQMDC